MRSSGALKAAILLVDGWLLAHCARVAARWRRTEMALADALRHQASHDPLTGLPNRLAFAAGLGRALEGARGRASGPAAEFGVIYLDVDRFDVVNDSLGRAAGDELLVRIAARLGGVVTASNRLARVGSDEFAVRCDGAGARLETFDLVERIRRAMTAPFDVAGNEIVVSFSAGIAFATPDSSTAEAVLLDAETAMFTAKYQGRSRSAAFVGSMRTTAVSRMETEVSLRHSIDNGELVLHYQPIVRLADGQIVGHEALVRWVHPTRGLVGPNDFIHVAEESGLIVPLGAWVLQEACRQARRFQLRDPQWAMLTMSVNLSGCQLVQPGLVELIAEVLHDAGLRAEHLQLEMTEGILMDDAAATITILQALKGLGVRLDVDDFGTGYSSLAYLKRFPVDVLKIDHSFVHDLGVDPEDKAIVAAVVGLADALGFTVVAEGVETGLQRDCLVDLGCARAQGYLFAHPRAALQAEAALDRAALNVRHSAGAGAGTGRE